MPVADTAGAAGARTKHRVSCEFGLLAVEAPTGDQVDRERLVGGRRYHGVTSGDGGNSDRGGSLEERAPTRIQKEEGEGYPPTSSVHLPCAANGIWRGQDQTGSVRPLHAARRGRRVSPKMTNMG